MVKHVSFRYNVHLAKTARLKTQLHHLRPRRPGRDPAGVIYSPVRTPPIPETLPPFPSARPPVFVSIANFVPKRAWHPPNANPAHSKASHCDGLNFVGCHDLWYQVCETILAFLSGHRNLSTRPAHLSSEWRNALVSGGRARSCTRLASTPVFAISRLWHGVLQPRAAVDRSGSSFFCSDRERRPVHSPFSRPTI